MIRNRPSAPRRPRLFREVCLPALDEREGWRWTDLHREEEPAAVFRHAPLGKEPGTAKSRRLEPVENPFVVFTSTAITDPSAFR